MSASPEPDATDDQDLPSGWANPEWVAETRETAREERVRRTLDDADAAGTKAWLEASLAEDARTAEIYGREFTFTPIGTDFVSWTVEVASQAGADDDLGDMPELLRRTCRKLGEHCHDPEMGPEEFLRLPPTMVEGIYEEVASELSPEERERAERFRSR